MRSTDGLVLAADAAIDLQLHTTYSDGQWTPATLIAHLRAEGFGLAAITDHDRVDTVGAIQQVAAAQHFPVLVAAEMSTRWRGEMTDVLCYGFDPDRGALAKLAADVWQQQREMTRDVYGYLVRAGHIEQVEGELARILSTPSAQQAHEIVAVVQQRGKKHEASVGEILKQAGFAWVTNEIAAVVEAVRHDGGVCLIAHPGRADFTVYDVPLLDALRREVPIDGLEVYYPAHTAAQTAMYAAYAEEHGLLVSSGSDSHRPAKPPIQYRAGVSRRLLERVGIAIR